MRSAESQPSISAVVVTHNSAACVERCLESITEHLQPSQIIVVDNASTDGTVEAVRRASVLSIVIETGTNLGFGNACNLAVIEASSDVVVFVNPDVWVSSANLPQLEIEFEQPQLGLLVPLLSRTPAEEARHQIFPYRAWFPEVLRQTWFHLRPRELERPRRPAHSVQNAWAAAALLFVRREEFINLGGFDSRYFLYAEDLDLSRRYRESGLPVRLTDSVVGCHSGGASSSSTDSLRVAPLAWSILGTLEYLSHWNGDQVAARGAATVLQMFRIQRRLLLEPLSRTPLTRGRATRKLRQVEQIEAFLLAHARAKYPEETSFCPGARDALRTAIRHSTQSGFRV